MDADSKQKALDCISLTRGSASRMMHSIRKIPDPIGVNTGALQRDFNEILSNLDELEYIINKEK